MWSPDLDGSAVDPSNWRELQHCMLVTTLGQWQVESSIATREVLRAGEELGVEVTASASQFASLLQRLEQKPGVVHASYPNLSFDVLHSFLGKHMPLSAASTTRRGNSTRIPLERFTAKPLNSNNDFLQRKQKLQANTYATIDGQQVQVVPHGGYKHIPSKQQVPVSGFLCSVRPDFAPVLYTLSNPCVPKHVVDPGRDKYQISSGHSLHHFADKKAADTWCNQFMLDVARKSSVACWDGDGPCTPPPSTVQTTTNKTMAMINTKGSTTSSSDDWLHGRKRLLFLVMDWRHGDNSLAPYSRQEQGSGVLGEYASNIIPRLEQAFREMSYGKYKIDVTIVPQVVRYNMDRAEIKARGSQWPFPALHDAAVDTLFQATDLPDNGYNPDDYDLVYTVSPQVDPMGVKGVAWVGSKGKAPEARKKSQVAKYLLK